MSNTVSLSFYILSFLTSAYFFSYYKKEHTIVRWIGIIIATVIPSLIAGLRYNVGTDWSNYYYILKVIKNTPVKELLTNSFWNVERGFLLLSKALVSLGGVPFAFGGIAFITLLIVEVTLIRDYPEYNITLAYFIYLFTYFTQSFNIVRQILALSFVFAGMKYVFESKPIKFLWMIAIATSFHRTSLIAIPIYLMWNREQSKALSTPKFLGVAAAASVIVVFWRAILRNLLGYGGIFIKYIGFLNDNVARNRDFYVKVIVFVVIYIIHKRMQDEDEKHKMFLQMGFINLLIGTTGFYITFFKRIGLYYEIPIILLLTSLENAFTEKSKTIWNVTISVVVIFYFILVSFILGHNEVFPYQIYPKYAL